ncbi:MAG TPA: DUF4290 domain-containing protein [Marinilabiliaceae bacterium]|nr:DUF4290 domain-containing protein [Marinilabiliaceae bacterium]
MNYNSQLKPLVLPEYGRHIHQMVDHVMTIEDREERTRAADAIVTVMGNLFPHLRDVSDFKHKLWDHLAIMSDFQLDIDFPYTLPERENFDSKPDRVPYSENRMAYRHYGRLIEEMVGKAVEMEDGELRNHLITLLSNHMRKSLFNWNKDHATDERIQKDIYNLSKGKLKVDINLVKGPEIRETRRAQSTNRPTRRPFVRKARN